MQFYVKNPEDEYDVYEFECRDGGVCFEEVLDADKFPESKMARKPSLMLVRGMTNSIN